MKPLSLVVGVFLFILFFVWGLYYHPLLIFEIHFPEFHILFFIFLITVIPAVYYFSNLRLWSGRTAGFFIKNGYIIFPALAFSAAILVSILVFGGIPHIQDSIHYRIMAQHFRAGKWHNEFFPLYGFMRFMYLMFRENKMYSLFLPGFSFFLIPFVNNFLYICVNPVLTGLNVFLTGKIAERVFDRRIAVISMLFSVISFFLMIMGGTFLAHPFSAALTLLSVFYYFKTADSPGRIYPFISGFFMGWLLVTRPQNAIFIVAVMAAFSFYMFKDRKIFISKALCFAAGFIPWGIFLMWYNAMYTGNFFVFKQDLYFNYSEPRNFCHRLGIGKGCPNSNWVILPPEGLTWGHAFYVSYRRLASLVLNLFSHPAMMFFPVICFIFPGKNRDAKKKLFFILSIFIVTVAGYFFFYFDGNVFGPRYFYEVSFFLVIFTAAGVVKLSEIPFVIEKNRYLIKAFISVFVISAFTYASFFVFPPILKVYSKGFWNATELLEKEVEKKGIKNAVVFVSPHSFFASGMAVMDHDDYNSNDVIYLRDLGKDSNSFAMNYYDNREYYMASFLRGAKDVKEFGIHPPVIEKIQPSKDAGQIHMEMEDKKYPVSGIPDYCNIYPIKDKAYLLDYIPLVFPPEEEFSKDLFYCRFTSEEQYYEFAQYAILPGPYKMAIRGVPSEFSTVFGVSVNGKYVGKMNLRERDSRNYNHEFKVNLNKSVNMIRFAPQENINEKAPKFFILDKITFSKIYSEESRHEK